MKRLVCLAFALCVLGCHSKPPAPTASEAANKQARHDLTEKLKAMPKDQQYQYLKDHPDELRKVTMGTTSAPPSRGR